MREPWIDSWKGMLIFLVIVGHVAGMMYHFSSGASQSCMELLYKCIYTFHMPAFFFLAGYVGRRNQGNGEGNQISTLGSFVIKRSKRLLVPYFVWGVASVFVFLALGKILTLVSQGASTGYYADKTGGGGTAVEALLSLLHAGGWPKGEGFRCNSVLWFLPCMFVVLLFRELLVRLSNTRMARQMRYWNWGVVAAFFILGGAVRLYCSPFLPWGLSSAPFYLAFVLLGEEMHLLKDVGIIKVLIGWTFFILVNALLPHRGVAWHHWHWYFIQSAMAVIGCILSLYSALLMSNITILQKMGVASLGIMLCHKFLILPLQIVLSKALLVAKIDVIGVLLLSLVLSSVVAMLAYLATRLVVRYVPWSVGERL